ncbi:MAG: TatD family hydrolase, partial [Bacillota bacterium]
VFHCFNSDLKDAKRAIDLGFYIGIDGPITFKKAEELVDIVKAIDLEHILVETDSPYLAPMPFRGKRNEPAYTKYVVEKIAEIKDISIEEVMRQTSKNAQDLFNLGGKLS